MFGYLDTQAQFEIAKEIVKKNADCLNKLDYCGTTIHDIFYEPTTYAIDILNLCLSMDNFNVNCLDKCKNTYLMCAIGHCSNKNGIQIIKILLNNHKTDLYISSNNNYNAKKILKDKLKEQNLNDEIRVELLKIAKTYFVLNHDNYKKQMYVFSNDEFIKYITTLCINKTINIQQMWQVYCGDKIKIYNMFQSINPKSCAICCKTILNSTVFPKNCKHKHHFKCLTETLKNHNLKCIVCNE